MFNNRVFANSWECIVHGNLDTQTIQQVANRQTDPIMQFAGLKGAVGREGLDRYSILHFDYRFPDDLI